MAGCITLALSFLANILALADLPADAAKVVNKIISYAHYFAGGVVEIESAKA